MSGVESDILIDKLPIHVTAHARRLVGSPYGYYGESASCKNLTGNSPVRHKGVKPIMEN